MKLYLLTVQSGLRVDSICIPDKSEDTVRKAINELSSTPDIDYIENYCDNFNYNVNNSTCTYFDMSLWGQVYVTIEELKVLSTIKNQINL